MQEQSRPERLVEYFCTVGLSSPLTPLWKDGVSPATPVYALCLTQGKDEPPASFTKLERCYYGESANLNAGNANVFSPSLHLCIGRTATATAAPQTVEAAAGDDTSTPITDLIILYPEKGERCPPGYLPVPVHGPVNKYTLYGKAVLIAYSRATAKRPLLDIILCSGNNTSTAINGINGTTDATAAMKALLPSAASSNQQPPVAVQQPTCKTPPNYTLLKKDVNLGTFHHHTYIATLSYPSSLSSLLFRPSLLDRYPLLDVSGSPLPESLPYFCFPEGGVVQEGMKREERRAECGWFVCTQPNGLLLYCATVTFWEAVTVDVEQEVPGGAEHGGSIASKRRMSQVGGMPLFPASSASSSILHLPASVNLSLPPLSAVQQRWAPKCIVLVSYYPYFQSLSSFLLTLYKHSLSQSPIPVERLLLNLWETPLPRPSHQSVQLRLPASATSSVTFLRLSSSSSLPHCDFSFVPLFHSLSLANVLLVLTALLNEKKLVLYSTHSLPQLPIIASALTALLFPLQWASPFLPLVPALSSHILEAPMPVLAGVDGRYALHRLAEREDVCVVGVDEDEVKIYGKYTPLPESAASKLKRELSGFARIELVKPGESLPLDESNEFDTLACRACFLHLMVTLLLNIDEFLLFPSLSSQSEPSFEQLFNLPGFLASPHQKYNRHFLRSLSTTQMFSHFIEEKTYTASSTRRLDLLFFDECCRYELEHRTFKERRQTHPPLITRLLQERREDKRVWTAPLPDVTDLPAGALYGGGRMWQPLKRELMCTPRPVDQRYLRDAIVDENATAGLVTQTPIHVRPAAAQNKRAPMHPLPSVSPHTHTSPLSYAKSILRDTYAVWFELYRIGLPTHSNPHLALLNVFEGLVRMTKQGVDPDVGIYRSVLSICGRWRRTEEAQRIMNTMRSHGVKMTSLTYGAYTSGLAESSNEMEMERERQRTKGQAASADAPSTAPLNPTVDGKMDEELATRDRTISSDLLPSTAVSRPLLLDPYRLAADKQKHRLLRAQRQRVRWSTLSMSVNHVCSRCRFEMGEGEILLCFMQSPQQCSCPQCHKAFTPGLSVIATIVTDPPRLKSLIFRHLFHRPLPSSSNRYHIDVPLLSAASLRARFLSAASSFPDDLRDGRVMRAMHEVVYWNAVWSLSQPYNTWDLTFLMEQSEERRGRVRVRRRRRGDEDEWEMDEQLGGYASKAGSEFKARSRHTIRVSEGVRERQDAGGDISPTESRIEEETDDRKEDEDDATNLLSPSESNLSTASSSLASTVTSLASTALSGISPSPSPPFSIDSESSSSMIVSPTSISSASAAAPTLSRPSSSSLSSAMPLLSLHASDAPVERELVLLLSRNMMQQAMELFLRHRIKQRAEAAFSPAAPATPTRPDTVNTQTPSSSATRRVRPSTSPHSGRPTAQDDATPTRPFIVHKKSLLSNILPSRNTANSGSTTSQTFSFADTSPNSPAADLPTHQRNRSASLSKSHSSNEVEAMKSSLVSVTQHAISAMRSGRFDLSPATRHSQLPPPASTAAQRSSSDNLDLSASVHWYPVRSAGTSVPLHCHCMFECFYRLMMRHGLYDSYVALCTEFNLAVGRLAVSYLDEVTRMDLPPATEVQVIEVVVGIRKKEKGEREKGKDRKDKGDKSAGSASKKRDVAAAGKGDEEVKKVEQRTLSILSPLHKSSSTPLRATGPSPPTSASPFIQPAEGAQLPVSVTFPIAYPVASSASSTSIVVSNVAGVPSTPPLSAHSPHPSTPHSPSSPQPSTPSSHPTTPFTPSLLQYEQEVYAGSLSEFIGPNPDYRGLTPTSTPSRDSGSDERRRLEVDTVKREQQEFKSPSSPFSSSSSSSAVASPPSQQRHSSGESSSGGGRTRPPRAKRTTSSQSAAIAAASSSSSTSSPQSLSPSQPTSPRSSNSRPISPRTSISKPAKEEFAISPNRLARSLSQPGHTLLAGGAAPVGAASLVGLPSQSSHSLRPPQRAGTSLFHHSVPATAPAAPPKTFGQSLYQFLMTKPTGASAAASGGRGSASFTAAGMHGPRGRGAGGVPPNTRMQSVSGQMESTASRRREEKEKEDRSR